MRWVLIGAVLSWGCAGEGGEEATVADGAVIVDAAITVDLGPPMGDNPLLPKVENTTCRLPPAPPLGAMEIEEAWPSVDLDRPIWLGTAPGGRDIYVIDQGGSIRVFDPEAPVGIGTFLDLRVSRDGNEEGLLGLAFHPGYAENGRLYLYYSAAAPRRSVISEFRRSAEDPRVADPGSERILMEIPQPFGNHNGGDLRFGPDGYLYIALGDGGAAGDPRNNGQRPETVLGSVLRVDVDQPDAVCGTRYGIPPDNPFAEGRCGADAEMRPRPEVYAWGLRNIWRMAFDPGTGELWAADVGQDDWEEIDIIHRGGNYGWRAVEGDRCFEANCDPESFVPPIHVYGHDQGESITGGFVYRGPDLPELWGAYIFADYVSGRIWALQRLAGAEIQVVLLADTEHRITSFGQDADGRLYFLTFSNQRSIFRLRRRAGVPEPEPVPTLLSQTGCYADMASNTLAPGVIPTAPNAPFWSDGVDKARYFALPANTQMIWTEDDAFRFPQGAVLVKEFRLPGPDGAPRLFETRLLHNDDGSRWSGYSYRWRDDGSEADLIVSPLEAEVPTGDGHQRWIFPSRTQCDACHTPESGFVLGVTSRQLNGVLDYDGTPYNQLLALSEAGYLVGMPARPEELPAFVNPYDPQADLEARARAWLDTNCGSCHLPGATTDADIDLRAITPLADMHICDVEPRHSDDDPEARLLVPGSPGKSVLFKRLRTRGDGQMPPLASYEVDLRGRDLIGAWIQSLRACP